MCHPYFILQSITSFHRYRFIHYYGFIFILHSHLTPCLQFAFPLARWQVFFQTIGSATCLTNNKKPSIKIEGLLSLHPRCRCLVNSHPVSPRWVFYSMLLTSTVYFAEACHTHGNPNSRMLFGG